MKSKLLTLTTSFILITSVAFAADAPAGQPKTPANQIDISEYMFAPEALHITVGTKVTWVNHDDVPHTIVDSSNNKLFHSSALDTNDSYGYTFTKPGTYKYFCTLHPQMVGTIIVTATK